MLKILLLFLSFSFYSHHLVANDSYAQTFFREFMKRHSDTKEIWKENGVPQLKDSTHWFFSRDQFRDYLISKILVFKRLTEIVKDHPDLWNLMKQEELLQSHEEALQLNFPEINLQRIYENRNKVHTLIGRPLAQSVADQVEHLEEIKDHPTRLLKMIFAHAYGQEFGANTFFRRAQRLYPEMNFSRLYRYRLDLQDVQNLQNNYFSIHGDGKGEEDIYRIFHGTIGSISILHQENLPSSFQESFSSLASLLDSFFSSSHYCS